MWSEGRKCAQPVCLLARPSLPFIAQRIPSRLARRCAVVANVGGSCASLLVRQLGIRLPVSSEGNASDGGFVPQLEEARADCPYPRRVSVRLSEIYPACPPIPNGRLLETPDRDVCCARP